MNLSCVLRKSNLIFASLVWAGCSYQVQSIPYVAPEMVTPTPYSSVVAGQQLALTQTGGVAPLFYSILSGGGSISGNVYTAPTTAQTVKLRVTDSLGQISDKQISVVTPTLTTAGRCALLSDGTVQCWGLNNVGQLGNGTTTTSYTPVKVSGLSDVTDVSSSLFTSCALKSDGTVWCWGLGSNGSLGNGSNANHSTPVQVSLSLSATAIAVGGQHACAIMSDKTVRCWGLGTDGQLGDGNSTTSNTPVTVTGLNNITAISLAYNSSCALDTAKKIWCWGDNLYGELGDSTNTDRATPVATGITNTGAGLAKTFPWNTYFHCAVIDDGTLKCWGQNQYGQLGDRTYVNKNVPTAAVLSLPGLTVSKVITSSQTACVQMSDNNFYCWGFNRYSQIGDKSLPDQGHEKNLQATLVSVYSDLSQLSIGLENSSGVRTNNSVVSWGTNGQAFSLGFSAEIPSNLPVSTGITGVSKGGASLSSSCIVKTDGTVWCWGRGQSGALGNGYQDNSMIPIQVPGITTATDVAIGGSNGCALLASGVVKCWGWGEAGTNGNSSYQDQYLPVSVTGIAGATQIAVGNQHACAVDGGAAKCWGTDYYGTLGDGTTLNSKNSPVTPIAANVSSVCAGNTHSCASKSDGTVWCWGRNDLGQLGDGTTTDSSVPVQDVTGITTASSVMCGGLHTCALLTDQTVKCWGAGTNGQLGNGSTSNSSSAVTVTGLSSVTSLQSSYLTTCALITGGTVKCWGNNGYGGIGNGNYTNSSTPTLVSASSISKLAISVLGSTTGLISSSGELLLFGSNYAAQYGNGTSTTYESGGTVGPWQNY